MKVNYSISIKRRFSGLKYEEAISLLKSLSIQREDTDVELTVVEDWKDEYEKSGTFSIIEEIPAYGDSDPSKVSEFAKRALEKLEACHMQ